MGGAGDGAAFVSCRAPGVGDRLVWGRGAGLGRWEGGRGRRGRRVGRRSRGQLAASWRAFLLRLDSVNSKVKWRVSIKGVGGRWV